MASVLKTLETAERIEALASQLYASLAERFAGHPSGQALFERLAREESQHALRIRMLASQVRKRNIDEIEEPDDLDATLAYLEHLISEIGRSKGAAELDKALGFSAALESRLANVHATSLCAAHPELREVFEELGRADREHRALIEALRTRKGG